jgi:glycosyltransferase involved in cell wall biosynthesis
MRIGIVPSLDHNSGGIYQYSLTMLEALAALEKEGLSHRFCLLYNGRERPVMTELIVPWPLVSLRRSRSLPSRIKRVLKSALPGRSRLSTQKIRARSLAVSPPDPYVPKFSLRVAERLSELRIELLIFPAPLELSFESGFPYVMAIHDLQHRLQPEFPEVSADGEWERREYLFRNGVRFSTLLIADSETGKEDILECYGSYGASADRVKVLPYLPANYISRHLSEDERLRVREKYHLAERYIFYPAQFWSHKNHIRIIQALGLLRETKRTEVHVVFCGSHAGEIREQTFRQAMDVARELSVDRQIHYLGYVPHQDMSVLYAEAVGLVMPTFFGPTNIPVLEAWVFGCPVVTSDIRGIREQVGDAALLVDPRSVESIAEGIYRLWEDDSLRCALTEHGRRRLGVYTPKDYYRQLSAILEEGAERTREEKPLFRLGPACS